jgi:hypothetical protein
LHAINKDSIFVSSINRRKAQRIVVMENKSKLCFKIWSQRVFDGFFVHLYNETYENPEQSYDMWQGHDASQERCVFLSDQDGSLYEGLWAENWESAKNAFHKTYPNTYEHSANTLVARTWDEDN